MEMFSPPLVRYWYTPSAGGENGVGAAGLAGASVPAAAAAAAATVVALASGAAVGAVTPVPPAEGTGVTGTGAPCDDCRKWTSASSNPTTVVDATLLRRKTSTPRTARSRTSAAASTTRKGPRRARGGRISAECDRGGTPGGEEEAP